MVLDVRTMYVAVAAISLIVAAALLAFQAWRARSDGTLQWALGWALQGLYWLLLGLRGSIGDFLSIVVACTCLTASLSLIHAALRQLQGRPCRTGILLLPAAATFVFFWYFSVYVDNLPYRIVFISLLTVLQIGGIVVALLRDMPVNERRSHLLTGFAFLVMAFLWAIRLIEALTLPYGQLSTLQATTFRNASVLVGLGVAVLSNIGFVLMIRERAEEILRWSEQRFRSLFETSRDSILLVNWETDRIVGANSAACELYGYSPEEFFSLTFAVVSEEPEGARTAASRSSLDVSFHFHRKKDGTRFPVEISEGHFTEGPIRLRTAFIRDVTEREKTEEQLKIANFGIESSISAISLADLEGRVIFANDSFVRLWGYEREEEVVDRHISELALSGMEEEGVKAALSGRGYIGEGVARRKDGSSFHSQVAVNVVKTDEGEPICVMASFIDITERVSAQEALRLSEERYRSLFNGMTEGFAHHEIVCDEKGEPSDYRFLDLNPAFERLTGLKRSHILGKTVKEALPATEPRWIESYGKVALTGEPVHFEDFSSALDRCYEVFAYSPTHGQFATLFTDITERRRADDALRESEAKLRAILNGSRDAIGVSKDGIQTFVNPAFVSLFGYARADDMIGLPIMDLVAPESRGFVEERVRWRASGANIPPFCEVTALKRDGTKFLMDANVSTYVLNGEEFAVVILRDVSEKKRLEAQLRQAQKMEAVGTLAGGIAHDFNNILTVIMGFADLIQMRIGKDDLIRPQVNQIVASSERAAELTRSLLAFSRKQRITLETHEVNGVVTSTAQLLARLLPEDIALSVALTGEDTSSLLDVTQMGQVLMNLATNARDAMPHGGSLTITTARAEIGEDFIKTHGFGRTGRYVKLSMSDTGTGMDRETAARIFEPFFTTKEVGKGTGLGLASAYGIVKQHNGYITVSSLPFEGTTFDIYLPLAGLPPRPEARESEKQIARGTETVLVVEDDPNVRHMLTEMLESQGYATIEAIDGDDAIRVYNKHKEQVDLIILDVVMPGKNGKEVLDEITRTAPRIKSIFVSGYTGDVVIDKGIQSEKVDFLRKPLSVASLLAKVREVLDR